MSPDDSSSDRYLILLEQIQGQVQLIAEGHEQLNQKIDRVESNLQKQIKGVESAICLKIDTLMNRLDRRLTVLERRDGTLSH